MPIRIRSADRSACSSEAMRLTSGRCVYPGAQLGHERRSTFGSSPSSSRRTRAEPTTTPSALHTSAACSGVDTPIPMHTGRSVTPSAAPPIRGARGETLPLAGHAHRRDSVDEAPGAVADLFRRSSEVVGATSNTVATPASSASSHHSPASSSGRSAMIAPVTPASARRRANLRLPGPEDQVVVGHHDERDPDVGVRRVRQDALGSRAPLERQLAGLLDDRTVDHRVGERDTHLDRICARCRDASQDCRASPLTSRPSRRARGACGRRLVQTQCQLET